ncbi:MAG: UbiA family prenyltransferase [Kiritimatiellae bacterium]|nr:UbiA family prenyltransferase [Kiritimatiellia bacterium]
MSNFSPWLQLVRLPNLLTVPGDPIAGFMLAGLAGAELHPTAIVPCIASSVCLYTAGIMSNDYFDFREDQRERPTRPLPRGLIKPSVALTMAGIVGLIGIGMAGWAGLGPLTIAIALTITIVLYNSILKRIPAVGPLSMGLCRGLNLLMGAAAAGGYWITADVVVIAAAGLTLFIAAVTTIASKETKKVKIGIKRWLPILTIVVCLILLSVSRPYGMGISIPAAVFGAIAIIWTWHCTTTLAGVPDPRTTSKGIGNLLRGLLFLQAAFCAQLAWPGILVGSCLTLLWPILYVLSKRINMS